jgi:hypothetical protein
MSTEPKALLEKSNTDPWIVSVFAFTGLGILIVDAICVGVGVTIYGLTGWVPPVHDIWAAIGGIGGLGLAMTFTAAFVSAISSSFNRPSGEDE